MDDRRRGGPTHPGDSSGDPEVRWRLADCWLRQEDTAEAGCAHECGPFGFEALLERHVLAFADHGAEFYAEAVTMAHERSTSPHQRDATARRSRALEQAYEIAIAAGETGAAAEIATTCTNRWGHTPAFRLSAFAQHCLNDREGVAA